MGWFYVITDEMRQLGLKPNELNVFAVIHGYSQDGQGCYYGSLGHLAEVCGISKSTARRALQSLVKIGLIERDEVVTKTGSIVTYRGIKMTPPVSNWKGGDIKMTPNNKIDNIREDKSSPISIRETAKFSKPTLDEVRAYLAERNSPIDAEAFFAFYESVGWKIGNRPMKSWQAARRFAGVRFSAS